jgi:hypothetical protein
MKPGRELDALIHQYVFGVDAGDIYYDDTHQEIMISLPKYSTDISAAWEVAQKIVDMDDDHQFEIHLSPSQDKECTASVRYWDKTNHDDPVLAGPFYILGESAPHAICLAALKAVGADV